MTGTPLQGAPRRMRWIAVLLFGFVQFASASEAWTEYPQSKCIVQLRPGANLESHLAWVHGRMAAVEQQRRWRLLRRDVSTANSTEANPAPTIDKTFRFPQHDGHELQLYSGTFDHDTLAAIRARDDVAHVEASRPVKVVTHNNVNFDAATLSPAEEAARPRQRNSTHSAGLWRRALQVATEVLPVTQSGFWGLDIIDQRTRQKDGQYTYYNAMPTVPVTVYVVDSGGPDYHIELGTRAQTVYCTSNIVPGNCRDQFGHGSHVAGIIGGLTTGVFKTAQIKSVKIMQSNITSYEAALEGLAWVAQDVARNPQQKCVVNLSFGAEKSAAMDAAAQRLADLDCVVVVAAGNNATDACNQSPTALSSVLVVGSFTEDFVPAPNSNWGRCVSLYAPGNHIRSVGIGGTAELVLNSGTSMAAPFVTGTVAQYRALNPQATAAQVRQLLISSATANLIAAPPLSPALTGNLAALYSRLYG